MSIWKEKEKWRYEFQYLKIRYGRYGFATKQEAIDARDEHRNTIKGTDFQEVISQKIFFRKPLKINITETGCFICTSRNPTGDYPRVTFNKQTIALHRFIYSLMHGSIPPGMVIMHTCDNPFCINPGHHKLGTQSENAIDKVQKGRHRGGKNGLKK